MSRYRGPKGKIVRRFGTNIYGTPKFDRLLANRPNPPGQHGATHNRRKLSDYGQQMLEKQKLKYCFGVTEKQFRITFERARRMQGITGDNLLILLESRYDNVVYRAGLAPTRDAARQLVLHGHLSVNGRRVNIPSCTMRAGDTITVKDSSRSLALTRRYLEESVHREVPEWVQVDQENLKVVVDRTPLRTDLQSVANEQLVVELYSK
ncbi:MAG TPA: 30S ribosomal protein S4 [Lentisphaeria bacterium]|jgi:small subunit ribosomal protein S4|nr:30S ribosomal protein S4 [Lentisphaeria bacterium]